MYALFSAPAAEQGRRRDRLAQEPVRPVSTEDDSVTMNRASRLCRHVTKSTLAGGKRRAGFYGTPSLLHVPGVHPVALDLICYASHLFKVRRNTHLTELENSLASSDVVEWSPSWCELQLVDV
ncbi:hypothetical protein MRX96_006670 [Rhipicephalus microplus]